MNKPSYTVSHFACHLLTNPRIEDKLFYPDHFEFDAPTSQAIDFPARSAQIVPSKAQTPFPKKSSLRDPKNRGLALLFFANHELLAVELYAWALLKFPEVSKNTKRHWLSTIQQEQQHLKMYLDRAYQLGADLTDVKLNNFFWEIITRSKNPLEFVCSMSLTVEQANLDFADHFRDLFSQMGDQETAEILQIVYRDELSHVKHGLDYLKRNKSSQTTWQNHFSHTLWPLSPKNAKALPFNAKIRAEIGFSEEYISRLDLYEENHSQKTQFWFFNPTIVTSSERKHERFYREDLASSIFLLGKRGDFVVTPRPTSLPWQKHVAMVTKTKVNFIDFKEFETPRENHLKTLKEIGLVKYWMQNTSPVRKDLKSRGQYFEKIFSSSMRQRLFNQANSLFASCGCLEETQLRSLEQISRLEPQTWIFKPNLGFSGAWNIVAETPLNAHYSSSIQSLFKGPLPVIAQKFIDRRWDFGMQFVKNKEGEYDFAGLSHYHCNASGQIRAYYLGIELDDLYREFFCEQMSLSVFKDLIEEKISSLKIYASENSFMMDAFGIDFFVFQTGTQFSISPMLEINPRWTLGHMALSLERRLPSLKRGLWLHMKKGDFGRFDLSRPNIFWTNDPSSSQFFQSVSVFGRNFKNCFESAGSFVKNKQHLDNVCAQLGKIL